MSQIPLNLVWHRFKAVIFDVDGTLYDQSQLRGIMARELALFYLLRPHRWREPRILSTFRRLREERFEREEKNLSDAQYRWVAEALRCDSSLVRKIADEWLLQRPLRHLRSCRPPGLRELFSRLRATGIKVGIFSDYPAEEKVRALELHADAIACATDSHINRFKPHPAGVSYLLGQLNVNASECLHIGDREDRDAICARRSGCASLIFPARHAKAAGPAQSYDRLFPTKLV